ncbi:unnamed protein product [Dibothriocephalus latus]|uniref:coproporphyrinogen oxidase n=1 Tax=Dibothriocephalus latus TaxID=60516 RepID=A0A3P7NQK7_DIBLA|nr:unnamed protein product [Dibothriocephalus latus]
MASSITPASQLSASTDIRSKMEILCMELQAHLCHHMEAIDKKKTFFVDKWERKDGHGRGIYCVLQDGAVFEKAGVNISVISSELTEAALHQMRERLHSLKTDKRLKFDVVGISSVNHPRNPHAPTMHFNFRFFELTDEDGEKAKFALIANNGFHYSYIVLPVKDDHFMAFIGFGNGDFFIMLQCRKSIYVFFSQWCQLCY